MPARIGPSFDCAKAKEALPALICGNDQLAWLDLRFTQAFMALRQQVGDAGQSSVRQEAIDFQAQVYSLCNLPRSGFVSPAGRPRAENCIGQLYQHQRNAWAARLSPPLLAEASRPLDQHLKLQAALQVLGYIPPSAEIDGLYGPATRAAIASWQMVSSREPTGVLTGEEAQLLIEAAHSAPAPALDPHLQRADQERRLAMTRAEADKARAEADQARAAADRARAEADAVSARERAEARARLEAAERERAAKDARGVQP